MSLWLCPAHGIYGGQVFCPKCGGGGEYVTLSRASGIEARQRTDPEEGLDPKGESPAPKADAQCQ